MLTATLKDNGDHTGTITLSDGRTLTVKKDLTSNNANLKCLVTLANRKIETLGVFVQCWDPVDHPHFRKATEWKTLLGNAPIFLD